MPSSQHKRPPDHPARALFFAGFCAIETGGGAAFVKPTEAPKADDYAQGLFKKQNIVTLDYVTWQKLCARWLPDGARPVLKPRSMARSSA